MKRKGSREGALGSGNWGRGTGEGMGMKRWGDDRNGEMGSGANGERNGSGEVTRVQTLRFVEQIDSGKQKRMGKRP